MQTSAIKEKSISLPRACMEVAADMREFGMRGVFRGQGIGIAKAVSAFLPFLPHFSHFSCTLFLTLFLAFFSLTCFSHPSDFFLQVISLTMFHEARIFLTECFIARNERLGLIPEGGKLGA